MRVYILRHVVFHKNTLPYVSLKQSQTNINFSPHLSTFVESFSKLLAHDNFYSKEVHVASPHINSDNVATLHVLIDDEKYY